MILLTVILAMYVSGPALYVWAGPGQDRGRSSRLLSAGGASVVAVAIPLLILALVAVGFGIELAVARRQDISLGMSVLLAALVVGPVALLVLGLLARRGRRVPAMMAVGLCVLGYVATLIRLLAASAPSVSPSAAEILVPATIGLLPAAVLVAGLLSGEPSTSGASTGPVAFRQGGR